VNLPIELSLCIVAWTLTLARFRAIQWKDIRKDNGIALHVWLTMVFFSTTSIFLIKKLDDFFDAYTFNNLDRLITYCSILASMTFGTIASINAVSKPPERGAARRLQYLLTFVIIALVVIYILFISRIPNMDYLVPRSLPEAGFMLITFSFGAYLCFTVGRVYLAFLPLEASPIMRIRSRLIILTAFIACAYFVVKVATVLGYYWPFLASQTLIDLSSILLVVSALSFFSALLGNKMYVRVAMISRNIHSWGTFKELRYLTGQLLRLCPDVIMPITNPSFWRFVLNPEYYLYRTIISIMDGKTILDDLLSEGALCGELPLWEGDTLRDVVMMKHALQCVRPSEDFWEIVSEYQRASRQLMQNKFPSNVSGETGDAKN
jgi:hypothetical protein